MTLICCKVIKHSIAVHMYICTVSQIPSIKGTKKYYTSVHLIINIVYGTKDLLPSLLTPNIRYDFFHITN